MQEGLAGVGQGRAPRFLLASDPQDPKTGARRQDLGDNYVHYKTVNAVYRKRKVRLCVMGNQQKEGMHCQLRELYSPAMKPMWFINYKGRTQAHSVQTRQLFSLPSNNIEG